MRRLFSLFLLLCIALTGCGTDSFIEKAPTIVAPVSLNVVTSYGGDDGNRRNFETAVAAFEEETGCMVYNESSVSNEEWKTRVLTDFMTGSEPDVLFYFTNADADPIVNADKVVSLEEIREVYPSYASNMKVSMMPQSGDGRHYAVPSTGYWEGLFVNKRVLNQCGVAMPGPDYTWEQFLEDCQVIKDSGFVPIACSLFEIPHYWFEFTVLNNGSLETHLDKPALDENGKLVDDETSRKWIAALNDITQLYQSGFFPDNTMTASDAETVAMFAEGKAAFLVDGSWKVGFLTENYANYMQDYVVCFVPGKGQRPATDTVGGISMGYFITRKAWEDPHKREAAVNFVTHMTSGDVLSTFVTTEVTALINGAYPLGLNVIQQSAADTNASITGYTQAVQDSISGEAKSELFLDIQQVVTGHMSAEDAVASAMKLN